MKKVVRAVNEVLAQLKVEKHPDKTFIGRAIRGFDFLGYFLKPGALAVANNTIRNMAERINRLYEQGADQVSIGQYVQRWKKWVVAGIGALTIDVVNFTRVNEKGMRVYSHAILLIWAFAVPLCLVLANPDSYKTC